MKKPTVETLIRLEGKIIGAIMYDDQSYFYRPKRNVLGKGVYDPKWDGGRFQSLKDCHTSLGPLN